MIIDGQQRLATLSILLTSLRDYAKRHPDCNVNNNEINETYLINKYKTGNDKYKLLLTQSDRDILIKKIEGAPTDSFKSRILDNYYFFTTMIERGDIKADELFNAIGRLELVSITLDRDHDDPQAIFESLNSTGMDLKDSDLIRNHLLMGLSSSEQESIYNNLWHPMETFFDYKHQSEVLDNFFRDYLTMKLGRIANKNEIYKEFKDYQDNEGISAQNICKDIYSFAKIYADMYFVRSGDLILKSLYGDMKAIRMTVAYPFLLKVHNDYDNGSLTIDELREIIRLCISYVLRRDFCSIPTHSMNKTFAAMKDALKKDDYLNSVKAFFILLETFKEFPNDEQFIAAFETRDVYNMQRCLYILEQLEKWDNKVVVDFSKMTIEHIIPQNPNLSTEWISALGSASSEIQKRCLHSIGNLTLTKYNSEMSDASFAEKLSMEGGFKESALRINKYVVNQSSWGEKQVKERAALLGDIAKRVWLYPSLKDAELAPYLKKDDEQSREYSLERYKLLENGDNRSLFDALNARILNLSPYVKRQFNKLYVSYKVDTNFVDVVITSSRLRLTVNIKFTEVVDPKGICEDVTNVGKWGNGDVRVNFENIGNLDDVMEIVEQAFRLQDVD
jgi:uncharacterized protein with ParB-like and HNH nuclease domain/predicted transport protein